MQNVEAMKRQLDQNPAAFSKTIEEGSKVKAEERKDEIKKMNETNTSKLSSNSQMSNTQLKKRKAIDKQTAF
jgi:hypothetical protein